MKKYELLKWVIANALGLGIGFVAFLQVGMLLQHGFDFEKHWSFSSDWDYSIWGYITSLISALVAGVFWGMAQAGIVKLPNIEPRHWVLVTAIGYMLHIIILDWPLHHLGNLPGALDPLIVTVGGGVFVGLAQYYFLRKRGVIAKRWLLLWISGLFLSLVPTVLFFMFIAPSLELSWPIEVLINGAIIGGVAAWTSGRAFFNAIME